MLFGLGYVSNSFPGSSSPDKDGGVHLPAWKYWRQFYLENQSDFDDILQLAASVCEAPIAFITLLDEDGQWLEVQPGFFSDRLPGEVSLHAKLLDNDDILIVTDTSRDERFNKCPNIRKHGLQFYAGVRLVMQNCPIGTLSVMGHNPRELSAQQIRSLQILGKRVIRQLEMHGSLAGLQEQKVSLETKNAELQSLNDDMHSSEEHALCNLEHISALQKYLEVQEQRYRELVENATDIIYELDHDGKFSFVNNVLENLACYEKEELITMTFRDLVHPAHQEEVTAFYNQQQRDKTEVTYREFVMRTKTGRDVWIGQNVRMFFREDGFVNKVSAVARDITALKKAELKLGESEKRFRLLSGNAPVGIFQFDWEGHCTYVNMRWCEIAGTGEKNALGSGWLDAIHQADRQKFTSEWMDAILEEREFVLEYRLVNPQTGIRWVFSRAIQIIGNEGEIVGYIGTTGDITELKEVQEQLGKSEELYRLLTTNAKDLITLYKVVDQNMISTFVSPSVVDILGYEQDEIVGRSPFETVHPDDVGRVRQTMDTETFHGRPATLEYRVRKKDGTIIWLESRSQPYFDNAKTLIGFQTSARDITSRKEFEASLKEAKDKAEEATKAKSMFLSMMSHEIRTPMNAIIGLTNLLLDAGPRDDQRERLELLQFSGKNLLTIIDDILDFSKIEAGKITLESINVDLHQLMNKIKQMLDPRATEKGIDLRFIYDDKLPKVVRGDQVRISQIITNLLSNAIKFTSKGYVELSVTSQGKIAGKHEIHVRVTDTGIGIAKEKAQHIFENFSQADDSTTRKFGGTGLGLAITKNLLQLMGSEITLESELGKGSSFSFVLCLEAGDELAESHEMANTNDSFSNRNIKVLLVEDNRINQIVAVNFLNQWGIEVTLANNGQEALEYIMGKEYQLILMDLQMPLMDGWAASQKIRALQDPYFKQVPIIALTASAMSGMKDKVEDSGMNDFITKPFNPQELKSKIRKYSIAV